MNAYTAALAVLAAAPKVTPEVLGAAARAGLNAHGVRADIEVRRNLPSIGRAEYGAPDRLVLNPKSSYIRTDKDTADTIAHEVAHLLVGPGHGHSQVWRDACAITGANPYSHKFVGTSGSRSRNPVAVYCGGCAAVVDTLARPPRTAKVCDQHPGESAQVFDLRSATLLPVSGTLPRDLPRMAEALEAQTAAYREATALADALSD